MIWEGKVGHISSVIVGIMGCLCLLFGVLSILKGESYIIEYTVVSFKTITIRGTFLFDWISWVFIGVVLVISRNVLYYSVSYMSGDILFVRFIYLVLLFVISIILVVVRLNFIRILLGWDGLGLVSYCLVIYYQNPKSFNAGILTVLSNRVGDVALLVLIGFFINIGEWNFYILWCEDNVWLTWVGLCVLIAGLTKRAQIPFSAWLPAAIAAPTPVSALVHSSTLVTAGVYLFIRFYETVKDLWGFGAGLVFIGVITCLMSRLGANYEYDLKRIIALSTLSQLGLIISSVALGASFFCLFSFIDSRFV